MFGLSLQLINPAILIYCISFTCKIISKFFDFHGWFSYAFKLLTFIATCVVFVIKIFSYNIGSRFLLTLNHNSFAYLLEGRVNHYSYFIMIGLFLVYIPTMLLSFNKSFNKFVLYNLFFSSAFGIICSFDYYCAFAYLEMMSVCAIFIVMQIENQPLNLAAKYAIIHFCGTLLIFFGITNLIPESNIKESSQVVLLITKNIDLYWPFCGFLIIV